MGKYADELKEMKDRYEADFKSDSSPLVERYARKCGSYIAATEIFAIHADGEANKLERILSNPRHLVGEVFCKKPNIEFILEFLDAIKVELNITEGYYDASESVEDAINHLKWYEADQAKRSEDGMCPDCNGSGEGMTEGAPCQYCHGEGERKSA